MNRTFDRNRYAQIARMAAAESCVLLKNDHETLPLRNGDKVAVFGRCAFHYYKSGIGSGGLVNTRYVVSILDALKKYDRITLEEKVLHYYEKWIEDNPIDEGNGWGTVPWSQKEMPLTDEMVEDAKDADVAIIIIGRTAGEDQDNKNEEGSYLLTHIEKDMINKVSRAFKRTVVLLNVGNIIDMNWVEECNPSAVMYVWQGGQEGGNGVLDVLTGRVNPCGKLTDTIARDIKDYPSSNYFGDKLKNYYKEDIYVGYRYFETCGKERVQYPFGFGLSYTQFTITAYIGEITNQSVEIKGKVDNVGNYAGKQVIQVYVKAPQGKLDKPFRVFVGFYKTEVIEPGEAEEFVISCPKSYFASYDDSGVTGDKSCFLLEEGNYRIYVGADVRSASCCGNWNEAGTIIERLEEACAPAETFERFRLRKSSSGEYKLERESVPVGTYSPYNRMEQYREKEIPYTGDKGYRLGDVYDKRIAMDEFLAQLSEEDLRCLFRGEGMCSMKVTPGTAGAFGGLTPSLHKFGIPVACCADGPSGIRMDCGTKAFSLPNGTALGCTYNMQLLEELFQMLGLELRKNKIDTLLGPGMNIHRNPLNGRNFEYVSEDPILSGKIAEAQIKGLVSVGVTGTLKHFCANNQEQERNYVEAVVSERALREIYLKGFEIAVKEGNARSIMTTYGPVNRIWTAGYFDLCTIILREQWKFKGIVMTDWWAYGNWEGGAPDKRNRAPMVIAQNDLYMCCGDAMEEENVDNVKEKLESGIIKPYDLQRNAKNILNFIMDAPVMLRELGRCVEEGEEIENEENQETESESIQFFHGEPNNSQVIIEGDMIDISGDTTLFGIVVSEEGEYQITLEANSSLGELAQLPVSVYMDNIYRCTISFQGTNGKKVKKSGKLGAAFGKIHYIKLVLHAKGIEINRIEIENGI